MTKEKRTKYIFVTGGVISGLGKGIASASIGYLLKARGFNVTIQKFDPYINVDPGTMSPYQHGEVFVLDDGSETDLDLGHYERFIDVNMTGINNTTTGQVYNEVITRERRGDYLGATVQVIPHITGEIQRRIVAVNKNKDFDIVICEIGGTVGDIESLPFLEAIRQFAMEQGREDCIFIHLTLVPYISASGELKTKPTQHSVGKLREIGILPDILMCRSKSTLPLDIKKKISLFCNVEAEAVIEASDAETIYEIPLNFDRQMIVEIISKKLNLPIRKGNLKQLENFVEKIKKPKHEVTIGICGKYTELHDAYKSIIESFTHAGADNDCRVNITWIESEKIDTFQKGKDALSKIEGLLVPGGFGERGIEGKITAIQAARETGKPFFGICLGMQCAVIEFARNVCGLEGANSEEFDDQTPYPVIALMEEQKTVSEKGGTMRLGAYPATLQPGTLTEKIYKEKMISERHRHRYEVNNQFVEKLKEKGMVIGGINEDLNLVEICEYPEHPYFIGCQFHPELKSRVGRTHPLFKSFVKAALDHKKSKKG
ncbi:MAG: CTP synthase [Candidatus Marinimicrobia bacterium]|nr:CTP synthase [Candidatus Neomarinimicrobiota bacterium]